MKDEAGSEIGRRAGIAIDSALQRVGASMPNAGLEGRILNRLAEARLQADAGLIPRGLLHRRGVAAPAAGVLAGGLVAVAIIAGSVSHSRRAGPGTMTAPSGLQMPAQGIGAASAVHPGAPATAPVPASPAARGRSTVHQRRGRARITRHAHRAPGVVVPVPEGSPRN